MHPADNDADDPEPETAPCPTCAGAGVVSGSMSGDPTAFLKPGFGLAGVDPRRLLPNATLYIHVSAEALRAGVGVARMEGVGPITHRPGQGVPRPLNVQPVRVVDLPGQVPVDGYEVPATMREALYLRNPACVAPYATNLSRGKDADHVVPYLSPDKGGPPGQTSMENLGLLGRFPHRVKTHGRWSLRQPSPGVFEWRSPHGYWFRVDHTGTHPLGKNPEQHSRAKRASSTSLPAARATPWWWTCGTRPSSSTSPNSSPTPTERLATRFGQVLPDSGTPRHVVGSGAVASWPCRNRTS